MTFTTRLLALGFALAIISPSGERASHADDHVDLTTTWFQEKRRGGEGGLTVVHPQLDAGIDLGEHVSLDAGYSADVISGATAAVYSTDAVSMATPFEDTRHEGRLSLGFRGRRSAVTFAASTGSERDYNSIALTTRGNIDLPGKNTNVALSYTHNFDEVCTRDNGTASPLQRRALSGLDRCEKTVLFGNDLPGQTVWRDLRIDSTQATVTQNLTPTMVMQVGLLGQIYQGFQANPYRRVRVRGAQPGETIQPLEHLPDIRGRVALSVRLNKYLRSMRSALHFSGQGYSDTWGVSSGTVELGYSQYIGRNLLWRFRTRFYAQSAAEFFRDASFYESNGVDATYFAGDRELTALRHAILGAKVSYLKARTGDENILGVFDELRLNVKADLMLLEEIGPENQFLSAGQFIDGFVLQAGILLRY